MATLFSLNDGNLTDPNVFGQTMSAGDFFDGTQNLNVTTSFTDPSINIYNIISDGSSISAIAVNVNYRSATPTGTLSMLLSSGGSFVTETYAISSFTSFDARNNLVSNASQNWQILKLSTPFAATSGSRIRLDFRTSDADQLAFVGTLTAFDNSKGRVGTFNGTFIQSDSPFVSSPLETAYRFSTSQANFNGYNDAIFGTGDFTIELWFKLNATATYYPLLMKGTGYNGPGTTWPNDWFVDLRATELWLTRHADVTSERKFTYTPTVGVWTHLALCRKNGMLTAFINGTSLNTIADSTNYFNHTNLGIQMGAGYIGNAWQYLNGSITNARVIAGKALYLRNFTVPSSPLLLDSGTTIANYKSPTSPTYVSEITPFSGVNAEDGSLFFNGTSDYVSVPSNASKFDFSTNPFTIEFWVNHASLKNYSGLIGGVTTVNNLHIYSYADGSVGVTIIGANEQIKTAAGAVRINTWHHIALVRNAVNFQLYIDGISVGTYVNLTTSTKWDVASNSIGYSFGSGYLNGYMSNIRIVRGTALYTSNFTVPTAPLTSVTNTSLLLKAPYSPLSRNIDYSPTPFTGGSAEPSSLFFNGTSDYLTSPASPNYNFTSGTFTIECWIRPTKLDAQDVIASNYSSTTTGWTFQLQNGVLVANLAGNPNHITGTTTLQVDTWYHVAIAGSTGSYRMFLNGVQQGVTYTGAVSLAGTTLHVGAFTGLVNPFNGYISNFRILNGTALYTANFTPPTAPLTNIANTVYLLQSPYDQFGMLSIQSPFGVGTDSSVYIPGDSYLQIGESRDFGFGTDNFTIELWAYRVVNQAFTALFEVGLYSPEGIFLRTSTTNTDNLYTNGTNRGNWYNDTLFPYNQWRHIALCRNNNILTTYINGVSSFSVDIGTMNFGNSKTLYVGGARHSPTNQGFGGYISNFRVVKGTAVYTANFTPPTSPLSSIPNTTFLLREPHLTRYTSRYDTPFLLGSYGNLNKGLITTTTKDITIPDFIHRPLTKAGTTSLSSASPFGVGVDSSIYFGSGSVQIADTTDLGLGTDNFTIELWAYRTSTATVTTLFELGTLNVNDGILLRVNALYITTGATPYTWCNDTSFPVNQWRHIAVCRNNNNLTTYINGVSSFNRDIGSLSFGSSRALSLGVARHTGAEGQYFLGFISNFRVIKGTALYTSSFTVPTAPLSLTINTALLYKNPYGNTYLSYTPNTLHVGGSLMGLTSEARVLTASTIEDGDIYIHNQGKLTFPTDSSRTITINGSKGLQITSDGTLEIGTANIPISSTVQHSIILNNSQIDVHNGGNMNVYGSYKKPFTYLTSDSLSSARTFTVVDAVSTNWSVGDSVVFTPNTAQANSFDVLTLSSFDSGSTFRTTASAAFNHPSVTSLGTVPTVSNLSRNITIRGNNSSNRGTVRAVDAAKVNIANTQFTNFGIASANKTGFILGVNPNGYITLSGNAFNSDGFGGTTHITTISSKPVIGNLTLRDNVFFRSGGNGVSLSSVSATALTVTGNTLLSSNSSGLFFASVSSSGITMSDNTVIGARSNGTFIANSNINGDFGNVVNYRNGNSGLVLSASQCGSLNNIVSLNNINEGIYIDGSIPGLSNTTFSNITASNNSTLGFRVSGNAINHLSPITLNINRLVANNNLSGGFEGYSISGNLSSLELNRNGIYGMRTSLGNAHTTIDGITALMNNVASTSAGIGILSGTSYYPIIIKDAIVGGLSGSGISLDSTKFSQFNVFNSTVSGRSSFSVAATRNVVEGSYLISNTNVSNLPVGTGITNSNYQSDVLKTTGFAFTNMNNASGYNVTYLAAGNRAVDSTLGGNISASTSPSERLTPQSTTLKLRSGSKFVALSAGESTRISVFVRKSSVATNGVAYNGTSPRLILKRNAAMGIATDIVVDQLDTTSEIFLKLSGVSPAVSDTGVLEFYVDCDGTQGWINIDNWTAN